MFDGGNVTRTHELIERRVRQEKIQPEVWDLLQELGALLVVWKAFDVECRLNLRGKNAFNVCVLRVLRVLRECVCVLYLENLFAGLLLQ